MKMQNRLTGDTIEIPAPDMEGHSVVLFNGRIVERVTYSDDPPVILSESGHVFIGNEFVDYLLSQLKNGTWKDAETPDSTS